MKKQVAFRLEEKLLSRLKSRAKKEGRTQTWYVSTSLNDHFDKKDNKEGSANEEGYKD